jgi:hypothetical protein
MIHLRMGKIDPRERLTRLIRSPRTARAACVAAGLVLVAQTARAVLAYTREQDFLTHAHPSRALGRGGSGASGAAGPGRESTAAAGSDTPQLRQLREESQPNLVVSDLVAILDAAGIETYRYRLLLDEPPSAETEAAASEAADHPIEALLSQDQLGAEQADDLVPLEVTGVEAPPLPPGIRKWELAVHVQTPYPRLVRGLQLLETAERIWDVPRVCVYRGKEGTEADLRLVTYGLAPAGRRGAGRAAVPPAQLTALAPATWPGWTDDSDPISALAHDPFREARIGSVRSRPVPPRLGAIRLGDGEAAWLDGQAVRPGQSVGEWTLLEIHANEVLVRHAYGWKLCIRLHEPPGREAPDVQP